MSNTSTLDELWNELAGVLHALEQTPTAAAEAWLDLRARRDDLRGAIAALGSDDIGRMRRELSRLISLRDALLAARPNVAAMGGAGVGDDGVAEAQEMAWQWDRGQGRHELEARIRELERRIDAAARRGAAPGAG